MPSFSRRFVPLLLLLSAGLPGPSRSNDLARVETRADAVESVYGLTAKNVTVVILDRGIDWRHPDFINADGTTRIKAILDFSPACVTTEYTEAQINAALAGTGPSLPTRDAVGHGTVTAGAAAGNGRAAANGKYRGFAPEADLLIAKITGGAPAHGTQAAESTYYCGVQTALQWAVTRASALGQPFVILPNVGTQYGPIDGTDSDSRAIDTLIGENAPGRIFAIGTGDDGGIANHAGGTFTDAADVVLPFTIQTGAPEYLQIWYTGAAPAQVSVVMANGTAVGPVAPGGSASAAGLQLTHYLSGQDSFQSTSGDRLIMINVSGHTGTSQIRIRGLGAAPGQFDAYAYVTGNLTFDSMLAPGRISGLAATRTAVVTSVYVNRTTWTDLDGIQRVSNSQGNVGQRWTGSSSGPTRDGRSPGCDVAFPGHNGFAAYGRDTYWATVRGNMPQDGQGWYGGYGAASGSAPQLTGAIALLLQLDPTLTAARVRAALRTTARSDANTGAVPNIDWCYGKVDLYAAALAIADGMGQAGVVDFKTAAVQIAENGGSVNLVLRRQGGRQGAVSVQYLLTGGTADGADLSGSAGTVTWQNGDVADKTISIAIVDDTAVEASETATLELVSPQAARLGLTRSFTITITDNDVAPPTTPTTPTTPTQPVASSSGGGGGTLDVFALLGLIASLAVARSSGRRARPDLQPR